MEGGGSACADAIRVRGASVQHAYVYGCARVQRADKAMCVCVITYVAPPSPLYPPHASRDHAQYRRRARRGRSWSYRSGERGPPVPSSSRRRTTCRTTGCCPRRTRHRHCLRVSPGEGAAGPWGVPGVDAGRSVRSRGPAPAAKQRHQKQLLPLLHAASSTAPCPPVFSATSCSAAWASLCLTSDHAPVRKQHHFAAEKDPHCLACTSACGN